MCSNCGNFAPENPGTRIIYEANIAPKEKQLNKNDTKCTCFNREANDGICNGGCT